MKKSNDAAFTAVCATPFLRPEKTPSSRHWRAPSQALIVTSMAVFSSEVRLHGLVAEEFAHSPSFSHSTECLALRGQCARLKALRQLGRIAHASLFLRQLVELAHSRGELESPYPAVFGCLRYNFGEFSARLRQHTGETHAVTLLSREWRSVLKRFLFAGELLREVGMTSRSRTAIRSLNALCSFFSFS